jgi:hypothetical protein
MVDLFGFEIEDKALNPMQRISTRQVKQSGRDLYTTEPEDITRFIRALKRDHVEILGPIWEPAAGQGDISRTLIHFGLEVYSSDLYPYQDEGIKIDEIDFLTCKILDGGAIGIKTIFTNPPFNNQEQFLKHALSFGVDVIFFVRLSFLSSIRRLNIFKKFNPAYVYVYSKRANCYKNGEVKNSLNMIDYCVIMWKPPYQNNTSMRWIV